MSDEKTAGHGVCSCGACQPGEVELRHLRTVNAELLAALKRMDAMLCDGDDFSTAAARKEGRLSLIQARAAIARAEVAQ